MNESASDIRKRLREQRSNLSADTIATASAAITETLAGLPCMQRCRSVATYVAAFGEVDCAMFAARMRSRRKRTYVPILRKNRLLFAPWDETSEWTVNRYGIPEPAYRQAELLTPRQPDIVITPLVAYDANLNRLGMGGGYYDRSFAFRKHSRTLHKPLLIGVAYSFQRVDAVPVNDWDVPLDAVITEKESIGSY